MIRLLVYEHPLCREKVEIFERRDRCEHTYVIRYGDFDGVTTDRRTVSRLRSQLLAGGFTPRGEEVASPSKGGRTWLSSLTCWFPGRRQAGGLGSS